MASIGLNRPVAGFVTQEPTEDRRAVETREAQPVDRAVPAHQRRTVPVRQERIVGYRGRAHVNSFARTSAIDMWLTATVPPILVGGPGVSATGTPSVASPLGRRKNSRWSCTPACRGPTFATHPAGPGERLPGSPPRRRGSRSRSRSRSNATAPTTWSWRTQRIRSPPPVPGFDAREPICQPRSDGHAGSGSAPAHPGRRDGRRHMRSALSAGRPDPREK